MSYGSTRTAARIPLPKMVTQRRAPYSTRSMATQEPSIHEIFEPKTGSWQYIVADPVTSSAAIIDPVLDYDTATGSISTNSADALLELVKANGYKVSTILETHAHADHITAASSLQNRIFHEQGHRPPIAIGKRIVQLQNTFSQRYKVPAEELEGVFDKLLDDDEVFKIGSLNAMAIHLPGHTPDHMGYKIGGRCNHPSLTWQNRTNIASKITSS